MRDLSAVSLRRPLTRAAGRASWCMIEMQELFVGERGMDGRLVDEISCGDAWRMHQPCIPGRDQAAQMSSKDPRLPRFSLCLPPIICVEHVQNTMGLVD